MHRLFLRSQLTIFRNTLKSLCPPISHTLCYTHICTSIYTVMPSDRLQRSTLWAHDSYTGEKWGDRCPFLHLSPVYTCGTQNASISCIQAPHRGIYREAAHMEKKRAAHGKNKYRLNMLMWGGGVCKCNCVCFSMCCGGVTGGKSGVCPHLMHVSAQWTKLLRCW